MELFYAVMVYGIGGGRQTANRKDTDEVPIGQSAKKNTHVQDSVQSYFMSFHVTSCPTSSIFIPQAM